MENTGTKKLNLKVPSPNLLQAGLVTSNETPTPTRVLNSFILRSKEVGLFENSASVSTQDLDNDGQTNPFAETFKRAINDKVAKDDSINTNTDVETLILLDPTTNSNYDHQKHISPLYNHHGDLFQQSPNDLLNVPKPTVQIVPPSPQEIDTTLSPSIIDSSTRVDFNESISENANRAAQDTIHCGRTSSNVQKLDNLNTKITVTHGESDNSKTYCGQPDYQSLSSQKFFPANTNARMTKFKGNIVPLDLVSPSIFSQTQSPLLLSPASSLLQDHDLFRIVNSSRHNLFINSTNCDGGTLTNPSNHLKPLPSPDTIISLQTSLHRQQHQRINHHQVCSIDQSDLAGHSLQPIDTSSDHINVAKSLNTQISSHQAPNNNVEINSSTNYLSNQNFLQQYQNRPQQFQQADQTSIHLSNNSQQYPTLSQADYAQVILKQQTALYNDLVQQYQQANHQNLLFSSIPVRSQPSENDNIVNNLTAGTTFSSAPMAPTNCCKPVDTPNIGLIGTYQTSNASLVPCTFINSTNLVSKMISIAKNTINNNNNSMNPGQMTQNLMINEIACNETGPCPHHHYQQRPVSSESGTELNSQSFEGSHHQTRSSIISGQLVAKGNISDSESQFFVTSPQGVTDQTTVYIENSQMNKNTTNELLQKRLKQYGADNSSKVLTLLDRQQNPASLREKASDAISNDVGRQPWSQFKVNETQENSSPSISRSNLDLSDEAKLKSAQPHSSPVTPFVFQPEPQSNRGVYQGERNDEDDQSSEQDGAIIKAKSTAIKKVHQPKKDCAIHPRTVNLNKVSESSNAATNRASSISEQEDSSSNMKTKGSVGNFNKKTRRCDMEMSEMVLKKRSGGRRRRNVTSEELQARKNRSKERNRVAAKRCRQKRKVFMDELRKRTDNLDQLNQRLQKENMNLRRELEMLRSKMN